MISQESSMPLPQAIDDCYLTPDSVICTQPPRIFSRVAWFVETLKLHDMLRKTLAALYHNAASRDAGSDMEGKAAPLRQMIGIIEIDSQLQRFKDALPPELDWDTGIPILVRTLRTHPGTQNTQTGDILRHGSISSKFLLDCSVYCVRAAIDLACLVHQTCHTELSSVWFYNVFYSFTAGSVIILAQLSPSIVEIVARQDLKEAWDKCRDTLNSLSGYSSTVKDCAETLSLIRSKCQTAGAGLQEEHNSCTDTHVDSEQVDFEGCDLASDNISLTDGLFRDFDFNEDTLFDPFWFTLQF
ncbi:hypothetical protein BO83DRAFT_403381 [Aspergillus eucalypticola CBS 122712]|uniref:Transcription factor domain-containing protein n=1 Tax=Aspergillus eucalypticola (strain CBS 122712 / IBT 29274) TaxID=1448314 RepID=A0A317UPC2_ASPEC|nr:uncharacterized protein BO83DRAFT_403381 [Aspergillus eucalypticola CBS 122712]PWY63046.1 hypothetical protein BO83DRAFT_403381 [Aspergillus eucalypticola CBS 122712]